MTITKVVTTPRVSLANCVIKVLRRQQALRQNNHRGNTSTRALRARRGRL